MALSAAAESVLDAILRAAFNQTTFFRSINSEAIRSLDYNPLTGDLTITFTGNEIGYRFFDVPADIVARFLASPSKGKFYHNKIKGRFQA